MTKQRRQRGFLRSRDLMCQMFVLRNAVEFWIAPHGALHLALGRGAFEVRQMLAGEEPDQVGC